MVDFKKKIKEKIASVKPSKSKEIKEDNIDASTNSGVKLKKVNLKAAKAKKKSEEDRKTTSANRTFFKAPQGRSYLYILPPTSDGMNGLPFVEKLMHNNLGAEGDKRIPCMRTDLKKESRNDCIACVKVNTYWEKFRKLSKDGKKDEAEKYLNLAKSQGVKGKAVFQVLDVSGSYDKAGKVVEEFPSCFGDNIGTDEEKHSECRKCSFLGSCQKGVQIWEMQYGPYQSFLEKLAEEDVDVTSPDDALPMKLIRKGEGREGTSYITEWARQPIKIPDNVINVIEKHAMDLTIYAKPSTEEQMSAILSEDNIVLSSSSNDEPVKIKKVKPVVTEKEKNKMREKLSKHASMKKAQ